MLQFRKHSVQVTAPRGSFIVLDSIVYHSGGINRTTAPRRAVNHVYSIPIIRQQLDLPALLGERYAADPILAPFLGYGARTPGSVDAFYAERRRRLGVKG